MGRESCNSFPQLTPVVVKSLTCAASRAAEASAFSSAVFSLRGAFSARSVVVRGAATFTTSTLPAAIGPCRRRIQVNSRTHVTNSIDNGVLRSYVPLNKDCV
jgi:hypothetical protein